MSQIEFEDPIRNMAEKILGFDKEEPKIKQGTGQIYTFNQLGFTGTNNRPDGWYLPDDKSQPAIILETKAKKYNLYDKKCENELLCVILCFITQIGKTGEIIVSLFFA